MSERLEPIDCIQFALGSFVHIVLLHDLRWFLASPCFYHFVSHGIFVEPYFEQYLSCLGLSLYGSNRLERQYFVLI